MILSLRGCLLVALVISLLELAGIMAVKEHMLLALSASFAGGVLLQAYANLWKEGRL